MRRAVPALGMLVLAASVAGSAFSQARQRARDDAPARRAFGRFLEVRLEQPEWVRDTVRVDPGDACGAEDRSDSRRYWMAAYRIVSVRVDGGRATGVVDVLAAGEQGPDPDHTYATRAWLRVAHHVLRFPMRRDPRRGGWKVCEVATSGWRLGHDIIPHNIGIDHELIFAAIDSIRGVRHRRWLTLPPP